MSKIPHLIEVSLEERKGSGSSRPAPITKKLITAVSIEAPDLFRIHGVPCVDRGPDKLRLPVSFEHWRVDGSARREDFFATGAAVQPAKKTSNFARPSSVSEDAPNFFKVPEVAINRSSAITGVDAVCSPPPDHEPFNLPGTYMHGKEAKAVRDRAVRPGQWRETGAGTGQWGHATREFHELLTKMRREGDARGPQKTNPANRPPCQKKTLANGEQFAPPRQRQKPSDSATESSPGSGSNGSVNAVGVSPAHLQTPLHDEPTRDIVSKRSAAATREKKPRESAPEMAEGSSGGERQRQEAENGDESQSQNQRQRRRRRRASVAEVFMSRLEGERAPRNRRESVAAYKRLLVDCQTNNSAQLRDDAATTIMSGGGAGCTISLMGGRAVSAPSAATEEASVLHGVLARREAAKKEFSRLMGTAEGSYMLDPDADMSKIRLGRENSARTSTPPTCGVVRVSDTGGRRSNRR